MQALLEEAVDVIISGDTERARELLGKIHREKTFILADYYLGADVMRDVARYHAVHIAIMSLFPQSKSGGGLTGLDLSLSSAFAQALSTCGRLESGVDAPPELASFFKEVADSLNELVRIICLRRR